MLPSNFTNKAMKDQVILMKGGLNESVSSLERSGGEILRGVNYQIYEGSEGGYVSISGYERYDGQTAPSTIDATDDDHSSQDAARSSITEVPGSGKILGLHVYKGKVYAFRNKADGLSAGMYVESPSGWIEVDTSSNPLEPSGEDYNFVNYNFYASSGTYSMYWTDGVSKARSYDGSTVSIIDNSGMDVVNGGPGDFPINIESHDNRLFLAYRSGSLQYSDIGDPMSFSATAGEIGVGKDITDLVSGVENSLVIFCDGAIKVLSGVGIDNWAMESFSDESGSFKFTAKRILGTVYFFDNMGVTSLGATDTYGNFSSNSISQKVKKTISKNKGDVSCAVVNRDLNQYRLFFSTGRGLYFSFKDKQLSGVTYIDLNIPVLTITEGDDNNNDHVIFFGSDSGYVYKMDSGTSFDGEPIVTLLTTPYYHYKYPRYWKRFQRLILEVISESYIDLYVKPDFDYNSLGSPSASQSTLEILGFPFTSTWGDSIWGEFYWSRNQSINRGIYNLFGLGSNMSISLRSSESYKLPHTIQNMIVDFEIGNKQI